MRTTMEARTGSNWSSHRTGHKRVEACTCHTRHTRAPPMTSYTFPQQDRRQRCLSRPYGHLYLRITPPNLPKTSRIVHLGGSVSWKTHQKNYFNLFGVCHCCFGKDGVGQQGKDTTEFGVGYKASRLGIQSRGRPNTVDLK
jgi:hypothetical protein